MATLYIHIDKYSEFFFFNCSLKYTINSNLSSTFIPNTDSKHCAIKWQTLLTTAEWQSICVQVQGSEDASWLSSHCSLAAYLGGRVVSLAGQDAEVARGGDGDQALDVLNELLVVFGVPEHHTVLLALRLGEGVHHRAAAVAPLRERQCQVGLWPLTREWLFPLPCLVCHSFYGLHYYYYFYYYYCSYYYYYYFSLWSTDCFLKWGYLCFVSLVVISCFVIVY